MLSLKMSLTFDEVKQLLSGIRWVTVQDKYTGSDLPRCHHGRNERRCALVQTRRRDESQSKDFKYVDCGDNLRKWALQQTCDSDCKKYWWQRLLQGHLKRLNDYRD